MGNAVAWLLLFAAARLARFSFLDSFVKLDSEYASVVVLALVVVVLALAIVVDAEVSSFTVDSGAIAAALLDVNVLLVALPVRLMPRFSRCGRKRCGRASLGIVA